jgi:DNA polymerase delta subunit 1
MTRVLSSSSQKRVLADTTNTHHLKSPPSAKKRKLNDSFTNGVLHSSQNGPKGNRFKLGSSQPKSQFETEVLEKMTQDISDLKRSNAERDQQWDRPPLDDFNEKTNSLCFQQIEIEEGTLHGGKMTLKMFGVSEASILPIPSPQVADW